MVSILVPCFNHEKYIEDCIKSLCEQTYQDVELLINDDASKDNSWRVINEKKQELQSRFQKVYLHRNEKNQGITKSLNHLLQHATGDYIKIIASDDMLEPKYLEKCVEYLEKHEDIDAVITNLYIGEESVNYATRKNSTEFYYSSYPNFLGEDMLEKTYQMDEVAAPATIVRKRVYDQIGLYDEKLNVEDWDFWLRMLRAGKKFAYIDEPLGTYRKNANSASSTVINKNLEKRCFRILKSELRIIDKHKSCVTPYIYWARRNRSVMGYFYIAVNNHLRKLEIYTRYQQLVDKWILMKNGK